MKVMSQFGFWLATEKHRETEGHRVSFSQNANAYLHSLCGSPLLCGSQWAKNFQRLTC